MTDRDPNHIDPDDTEALKRKLNIDTGKINWQALAEHQQNDAVVEVAQDLDLIHVACEFVRDNRDQVAQWLETGLLAKVDDDKASHWQQDNLEVWAVVVAPWVLVQQPKQ